MTGKHLGLEIAKREPLGRSVAGLKEKQSASLELLFSQRGARNQPQIPPAFSVTLDYIEIPVQWHYADWLMEGEGRSPDWYRVRFNAGLSYSYLLDIRDKYENTSFPAAFPFFTRNTVALIFVIFFNFYVPPMIFRIIPMFLSKFISVIF